MITQQGLGDEEGINVNCYSPYAAYEIDIGDKRTSI